MSSRLPADVLDLVLRPSDSPARGQPPDGETALEAERAIGLAGALERRRLLYRAALVSRSWHAVATRLLADTVIVLRRTDVLAIDSAMTLGHLRGDLVRTLVIDDTEIETVTAVDMAWERYGSDARDQVVARDDPAQQSIVRIRYMDAAVAKALIDFSQGVSRLAGSWPALSAVKTRYGRSLSAPSTSTSVRSVTIGMTARRVDRSDWVVGWPAVSASVTYLRVHDFGNAGNSMEPLPEALRHLRHVRIGSRYSVISFRTVLSEMPAVDLEYLDIVLGFVIHGEPHALFRTAAGEVSLPSLRHIRLGISVDGLRDSIEEIHHLLAYLPPSVRVLDIVVNEDGVSDQLGIISEFIDALGRGLDELATTSLLRRVTLNVSDLDDTVVGLLSADAPARGIVTSCNARGIQFVVDEDYSGLF